MRIEQLRREFDLAVRWSVFPLHPETPAEGISLQELFAGRMDVGAMMVRLHQVAAGLDLPFGDRTHTYNSRKAQELGKWAGEMGVGEAFRQAVYHAYFADCKNIASPDVLLELAGGCGLDAKKALRVIDDGSYAVTVDADWQRARELGVSAVPTLVSGQKQLVGFQPYDSIRSFVMVEK